MPASPAYSREHRGKLPVLTWPALADAGIDAVVTTRDGGVSSGPYASLNLALHVGDDPGAVTENRRRAARVMEATIDDLVFSEQVHGRGVATVAWADRGRGALDAASAVPGADALVTAEPGPVLVTLVADCAPIVLVDPRHGVLACVHSGWRGTVARIVDAALENMTARGAVTSDVLAGIGPSVAPQNYPVGSEVADAVAESFQGDPGDALWRGAEGRWHLDLWAANRRLLVGAGVLPTHVHTADVGTGEGGSGAFYSARATGPCGRFALLARLRG